MRALINLVAARTGWFSRATPSGSGSTLSGAIGQGALIVGAVLAVSYGGFAFMAKQANDERSRVIQAAQYQLGEPDKTVSLTRDPVYGRYAPVWEAHLDLISSNNGVSSEVMLAELRRGLSSIAAEGRLTDLYRLMKRFGGRVSNNGSGALSFEAPIVAPASFVSDWRACRADLDDLFTPWWGQLVIQYDLVFPQLLPMPEPCQTLLR